MTLKNDVRFEEKLICFFFLNNKNFVNFDPRTQKFALYLVPFLQSM